MGAWEEPIEMDKVSLDIDKIPEDLYAQLLLEFQNQFGNAVYIDWEISAVKEPDKREEV